MFCTPFFLCAQPVTFPLTFDLTCSAPAVALWMLLLASKPAAMVAGQDDNVIVPPPPSRQPQGRHASGAGAAHRPSTLSCPRRSCTKSRTYSRLTHDRRRVSAEQQAASGKQRVAMVAFVASHSPRESGLEMSRRKMFGWPLRLFFVTPALHLRPSALWHETARGQWVAWASGARTPAGRRW